MTDVFVEVHASLFCIILWGIVLYHNQFLQSAMQQEY